MQKTALITGAAIRVGREIALNLADKDYNIVIHYNSSTSQAEQLAEEIRSKNVKSYLLKADLANQDEVSQIIPSLGKQGISLDLLINNAAMFEKDNIANIDSASWQSHINVNLFASLLLIKDFTAQYKGSSGNVINITDGMDNWSISPTFLSYSLSKLGLENATKLLAKELAPNIRINAIAPGPTLEGKQDKEDTFEKLKKIIPLNRVSMPQEICDTVDYILASPSLTGQIINLSGGMRI